MQRFLTASLAACLLAGNPLRADDATAPKAIIDKAIKALGGEERMAKLPAITWKATTTAHVQGIDIELIEEGSAQQADQYRLDVTQVVNGNKNRQVTVLNVDKLWITEVNGVRAVEFPKSVATEFKNRHFRARVVELPLLLREKQYSLAPLGEIQLDGHAAVGVQVGRASMPDINLFFDKRTGLPVKSEMRIRDSGQEYFSEFVYSDYKEFEGLKHFTKMTLSKDGKAFGEKEWTEIKPLEKLDDSTFAKP